VRVESLAAFLRRQGTCPGDRVAILQANSVDHVISWYAILRCGAICVDLNIALSAQQWAAMLDDCTPRGLLTDLANHERASLARSLSAVDVTVWSCAEATTPIGDDAELAGLEPVAGSDVALIAYTSGTTGTPKGVMHSHAGIRAELDLLIDACGFASDWTSYVAIPLFSMHGYLPQVAVLLTVGGTVVLADKFDPREFAAASHTYQISYTTLSSPMLPALCSLTGAEQPDFSSLKILSCGGAPLHPDRRAEFEKRLGAVVTEGYGLTEALGAFVMNIDGSAPHGASGRVYPTASEDTLRIQDENGSPVPVGTSGEIAFHRSKALLGYWPDIAAIPDGSDWFPTGDVGRIDAEGYLYLLDRKKDVILRGGFTIYSAEIERVLTEDPAVREATVIGIPDTRVGEVPIAFVVLADDASHDGHQARLKGLVREQLGPLKGVEQVIFLTFDDLPRNALGKVMKPALRQQQADYQTRSRTAI
jgi:long-chain acyl-CoA synthetase